jgi:hypothetical protein
VINTTHPWTVLNIFSAAWGGLYCPQPTGSLVGTKMSLKDKGNEHFRALDTLNTLNTLEHYAEALDCYNMALGDDKGNAVLYRYIKGVCQPREQIPLRKA